MPDHSSDAPSRSGSGQGRRRRNNRNRQNRGEERTASSTGGHYNVTRREPQQTGFQKFLSKVTFGLLGKPKPRAKVANPSKSSPTSTTNSSAGSGNARREERQPREARPPRQPREREPRHEPNPAEVTSDRLYVGNLSYDAAESDLMELFSGVGQVRSAEVVVNNRTQRSKGFAFVTMGDVEQARRAVVELSNKEFMGRPLQVSGAKPPAKDRDESES